MQNSYSKLVNTRSSTVLIRSPGLDKLTALYCLSVWLSSWMFFFIELLKTFFHHFFPEISFWKIVVKQNILNKDSLEYLFTKSKKKLLMDVIFNDFLRT